MNYQKRLLCLYVVHRIATIPMDIKVSLKLISSSENDVSRYSPKRIQTNMIIPICKAKLENISH